VSQCHDHDCDRHNLEPRSLHASTRAMSLRSHSGGSRRWNYFHSALELAVQRSAHKWKWVCAVVHQRVFLTSLLDSKISLNAFPNTSKRIKTVPCKRSIRSRTILRVQPRSDNSLRGISPLTYYVRETSKIYSRSTTSKTISIFWTKWSARQRPARPLEI
jgi:hypothetical protein